MWKRLIITILFVVPFWLGYVQCDGEVSDEVETRSFVIVPEEIPSIAMKRSMALGRSKFRPGKRSSYMDYINDEEYGPIDNIAFENDHQKRSLALGRSGFRPGKRSMVLGLAKFRPSIKRSQ
uniref:FMRF-Like Peptide n=1 Tax=Rhabditophanes sp. KR3021 TaxID=114890 RepID=A0AC35UB16_9BILA